MAEENYAVVELWNMVSTQWRVSLSGPIGLDYNSVFIMADVLGIEINQAVMRGIKELETAYLSNFAKKVNADGENDRNNNRSER